MDGLFGYVLVRRKAPLTVRVTKGALLQTPAYDKRRYLYHKKFYRMYFADLIEIFEIYSRVWLVIGRIKLKTNQTE